MSELTRTIASRLRQFIGDRRRAERCNARLPVQVSLTAETGTGLRHAHSIKAHTRDVSKTGLALIVSVIRINDQYLAGETQKLVLKLELPEATLEIQVAPVRYERLEETDPEQGYLIGVTINSMSDDHRQKYNDYIRGLLRAAR